jgi:hypothetical protein
MPVHQGLKNGPNARSGGRLLRPEGAFAGVAASHRRQRLPNCYAKLLHETSGANG